MARSFLVNEETTEEKDPESGKIIETTNLIPNNPEDLPYDLVKGKASLDVWAFGVLLYTLCAGESLFKVNKWR